MWLWASVLYCCGICLAGWQGPMIPGQGSQSAGPDQTLGTTEWEYESPDCNVLSFDFMFESYSSYHFLQTSTVIACVTVYISCCRGTQIPGARLLGQLHFVWWCLVYMFFLNMEIASCHVFESRIFTWVLDFWKICGPMVYSVLYALFCFFFCTFCNGSKGECTGHEPFMKLLSWLLPYAGTEM
jgi:hypothetical protein